MAKYPFTIVVGDVHGCLSELERLLKKVGFEHGDRLVMVGDLVAKGPDSQGVVQLLREYEGLSVLGNHDAHLLRWRTGDEMKRHHEKVAQTMKKADWRWLEDLPLYLRFEEANLAVVHGGLMPGVRLKKQKREHLLNLRSIDDEGTPSSRVDGGQPWGKLWKGPEKVNYGHDALRGLQRWRYATGLDTGCVYGRRLTAALYPGAKLVWVDSRHAYAGFD
jgi:hypothetical protein